MLITMQCFLFCELAECLITPHMCLPGDVAVTVFPFFLPEPYQEAQASGGGAVAAQPGKPEETSCTGIR